MAIKRISRWRVYRESKAAREGRVLRLAPGRKKKHATKKDRQRAYRIRRLGQVPGRSAGRPRKIFDPFAE